MQPFGFLLTLLSDFNICMGSDNVGSFLGVELSDLLRRPIADVFLPAAIETIRNHVDQLSGPDATERVFGVELQPASRSTICRSISQASISSSRPSPV